MKTTDGITTLDACPFCVDPRAGVTGLNCDALLRVRTFGQDAFMYREIDLKHRPNESDQVIIFAPDLATRRPCPHLIRGEFACWSQDPTDALHPEKFLPAYTYCREIDPVFGPRQDFLDKFLKGVLRSRRAPRLSISAPHRMSWPLCTITNDGPSTQPEPTQFRDPHRPSVIIKVSTTTMYAANVDAFLAEIASSRRYRSCMTRNGWARAAVLASDDSLMLETGEVMSDHDESSSAAPER